MHQNGCPLAAPQRDARSRYSEADGTARDGAECAGTAAAGLDGTGRGGIERTGRAEVERDRTAWDETDGIDET